MSGLIFDQNHMRSIVKKIVRNMESDSYWVDVNISVDSKVINPYDDIFKLLQSIGKQRK